MALSVEAARAIITRRFPALDLAALRRNPNGCGQNFETPGLIFRFPDGPGTGATVRHEAWFLREVAPALPLPVPLLAGIGRPGRDWPRTFSVVRRVAGGPGERCRPGSEAWPGLAAQMGAFLTALHTLPTGPARLQGIPVDPGEDATDLVREIATYLPHLRRQPANVIGPAMEPYLRGLVDVPPRGPLALCHADLKAEHIFVTPAGDRVTAIIDWADVAISDPAWDIGSLAMWLGPGFVHQVLAHYRGPAGPAFEARGMALIRLFCLRNLGQRLAGDTDDPLPLLRTQLRWAFAAPQAVAG